MRKRWLALHVENDVGVLAKIAGLFAGKNYNLDSLSVGVTDDETISRMTIGLTSHEEMFEQIKKQLNRCIGIIKVIDMTDNAPSIREIVLVKVRSKEGVESQKLKLLLRNFSVVMSDLTKNIVLVELADEPERNRQVMSLLKQEYQIEVVRSGAVGI